MAQDAGTAVPAAAADPKLEALRREMAKADDGRGVTAFIIPSEDPHMVRGAGGCGGSSCQKGA